MGTLRLALLFALALGACASTAANKASTPPNVPDLSRFSDKEFASEDLCEAAVSNYEKEQFLNTNTPVWQKGLFNRTAYNHQHMLRVQACTRLTERQAACVAFAPSMQYIRNCERFPELQ